MSLKDLPAAFLRSPSSFCSLLVAAILLFCLLKGQTLWKSKTVTSKNNIQQSKRRQRCFTQHHVEICRSGLESDWAMWCNLTSSFCNVGQINHLEMRKQGWSQNLMEIMTLLFLIFIEDFKWEFQRVSSKSLMSSSTAACVVFILRWHALGRRDSAHWW